MRWPTDTLVAGLAALLATSCAYTDGEPWGHADFTVTVSLELPSSRLTDEGRWKTTTNQSIDVRDASATVASVALTLASSTDAATFDPANPPAGYSLCHNGHCHNDDGALVDYEDIALELGQTTAGASIRMPVAQVADLLVEPSPLPLEPCDAACDLDLGRFVSASITLDRLVVAGRAFDDTDAARIPGDGLDVRIELVGPLTFDAALDGAVTRDTPVQRKVTVRLIVPAQLIDGVDFGAVEIVDGRLTDAAALARIEANLNEHAVLDVTFTP